MSRRESTASTGRPLSLVNGSGELSQTPVARSGYMPIIRKSMSQNSTSRMPRPHSVHGIGLTNQPLEATEMELLREVVFAFQGLNGRLLVQDPSNDYRYKIDGKYKINASKKYFALRLSNVGWLFNRVNKFCKATEADISTGHVMQSLAAALKEEILECYKLINEIEQQLHSMTRYELSDGNAESAFVSLHQLQVWSFDHFYRLKLLANLIEQCKDRRGGELCNYIYTHMQHGDPQLRQCLSRILNQVVLPIRRMLSQWIFHGELDDNYNEFFITTITDPDESLPVDCLWHDKYRINEENLPGFIPLEQARRILATGKVINLLLQVTNSYQCISETYNELKTAFETTSVDLLFKDPDEDETDKSDFRSLLHQAYRETSLRARKILFEDFKLMEHLNALRQFLLLGQGDFVSHFMSLIAPELEKPARKLNLHGLNNLMNSAIRDTNAQFLGEEVLKRLDPQLDHTRQLGEENVIGWDVFTLTYQTKGPIGTILTPRCMNKYSNLFKHLWHSKRMEYILASLWKKQKTNARILKHIRNASQLFHMSSLLLSEMTHFVQQMQYYIEFEVIECSWDEFIRKIEASEDVDQLVEAHEWFLLMVTSRSMLSMESSDLNIQLHLVYDSIIKFKRHMVRLWTDMEAELFQRSEYDDYAREMLSEHSVVSEDRAIAETKRRGEFERSRIPDAVGHIKLCGLQYQKQVQAFLLLLADYTDIDLQFLRIRLDFNEHYRKRNMCLETSLTYSHRLSISDRASILPK